VVVQGGSAGNRVGGAAAGDRNVISGNLQFGVWLLGSGVTGTVVQGNHVGLAADGATPLGNTSHGVLLTGSANNTVSGNVISGNAASGVVTDGATGNTVSGNYIGTDAAGAADRGNALNGVLLTNASSGNAVTGNLISGNNFSGVNVVSAGGNVIAGNRIGTDASGTAAVPNSGGGAGVVVQGSSAGNRIGGATAADRNVVSGNLQFGVWLLGAGVTGTVVQGNHIGLAADGATPLGNTRDGVRVEAGASTNQIGGTAAGAGNRITANGGPGVNLLSGTGNSVRGNSIIGNAGLGIDIGGDGVTANDAGDADGGPNGRQNFPSLAAVGTTGTSVSVAGTLNSTPGGTFALDFYANPPGTPAGAGAGLTYLGSAVVAAGADGAAPFSVRFTAAVPPGAVVTATATAADGSTSEFSLGMAGTAVELPVADAGPDQTADEAAPVRFDGTGSSDPAGGGLTYSWNFGDGATGSGPRPVHVYADDGVYTVTLVVRDARGIESADTAVVTVRNVAPTAAVVSVSDPRVEATAITVTGAASDPANGSDPLTFSWAVYKEGSATPFAEDGGLKMTAFTFTPDDDGTYRVVLTVDDGDGGVTTVERAVAVANEAPTVAIVGASDPRVEGTPITVTGTATDPAGANDPLTFAWTVTRDGAPFAGGSGPDVTFTPDDNGSYTVTLTVADDDGGVASAVMTVTVDNVAPQGVDAGPDQAVRVGATVDLSGTFTDPGAADTHTLAWSVVDENGQVVAGGSGETFSFVPAAPGTYTATFTVTDDDGGSGSDQVVITVTDAAATATITGPSSGQQGEPVAFTGSSSDPGPATYQWSVIRNGQSVDLTGYSTTDATFEFVPTEPGSYEVRLTVTTAGGSATATHSLDVAAPAGAVLLPGGRLVVRGTDGNDTIRIAPGWEAGSVKVKLNGQCLAFAGVTEVSVFANAGNDQVRVSGCVRLSVVAFGGAGSDVLVGGSGADVLLGGTGSDLLVGEGGRDILIGGGGSDLLFGEGGSDLLVAGSTAYDANLAALRLLRAEWTADRPFADRVNNLSGTGTGGANGPAVLRAGGPSATVFADQATDVLFGDCGCDWFLFHAGSSAPDWTPDMTDFEEQFAVFVGG
jgi:parallel beta-helix repeat protein